MRSARFTPHGQFHVQWFGEVLYSRWVGTFNAEAMDAYVTALKVAVQDDEPERWGRIVDLRQWEGMTPEAARGFEELAQWLSTTRCLASCQVFSSQFFQQIANKVASALSSSPNLAQVMSMAEAARFIESRGLVIAGTLPE